MSSFLLDEAKQAGAERRCMRAAKGQCGQPPQRQRMHACPLAAAAGAKEQAEAGRQGQKQALAAGGQRSCWQGGGVMTL